MIRLLIIILSFSANAIAQVEYNGHVADTENTPLAGVNVYASGSVMGTITDIKGEFHLKIPNDSAYLSFSFFGFARQTVKCFAGTWIEVRLKDPLEGPWKLVREKNPLSTQEDKTGTTKVYAVDTLQLSNMRLIPRIVTWKLEKYKVCVPLDSLLNFMRLADPKNQFVINFLKRKSISKKGTISLPVKTLKKIPEGFLYEFIVAMIRAHSIAVIKSDGSPITQIIVKDVYWAGNCSLCCWGGIQFFIYEKGSPLLILCTITSTIC